MFTEIVAAASVIKDLGAIGVLIGAVYAFATGKVVSCGVVDKLLNEANNRSVLLANEFKSAVRQAVRDGILEARGILDDNRN